MGESIRNREYRVEKRMVNAKEMDIREFFNRINDHFMSFSCVKKVEPIEEDNEISFWVVTIAPYPRQEMERFFDTVYGDKNQVVFMTPEGYIGYEEQLSLHPRTLMPMKVDIDYVLSLFEDEIPDGYCIMEAVFGIESVYFILEETPTVSAGGRIK